MTAVGHSRSLRATGARDTLGLKLDRGLTPPVLGLQQVRLRPDSILERSLGGLFQLGSPLEVALTRGDAFIHIAAEIQFRFQDTSGPDVIVSTGWRFLGEVEAPAGHVEQFLGRVRGLL